MTKTIKSTKNSKTRSNSKPKKRQSVWSGGFIASPKFLNIRTALIFVILFAGIGSYLVFSSFAAVTGTTIASLEAETMTLPNGTTIFSDSVASGAQAIQFAANGTATGTISLPSSADSFTVSAKGTQCKGAPTMVVKVDGVQVGSSTGVSATSWTPYNYTKAVSAGTHNLSISFTNYSTFKNCAKRLFVDKVVFMGQSVVPPPPVSDLMNRKDLIYGSEIGAWQQDGKPAIDLTTNIPNLVKAAKVPVVRFAMYDCFQGMTCGTDNHAGTQTRVKFDTAIDGIRNNLNAEPLFKLLPIAPDSIGSPTAIDGNKFCPPKTNLAMNLPLYKAVVDQAGGRIKLYESTNEGEVTCYNDWGYPGIASTGVSTTLGNHFAQNMPQLKKYARSKGIDIKTIGYVGYPQGASGWGNSCTNPSIKAVIEFNDAAYQAYVNSGNDPDYIPDAESIHTYPKSPDFQNASGVYDSDTCIFQYHKLYIQKWRQYLVSKWGATIGNQIKISDSEWQAGRAAWIAQQTPERMQQYYSDWYKYVLQGEALPDGSVGVTERWWNANLFLIASDNNAYDWIKMDGTTYPWYETIKNISVNDPNR